MKKDMEIEFEGENILFEKELNALDRLSIDFSSILIDLNIKNVIVSGYVPILFGRSRASEDIDFIIERLNYERFGFLWERLKKKFECLNTSNKKEAYDGYIKAGIALRFSRKNRFIPNIELKTAKEDWDFWTLEKRKKVILNKKKLFISPFEIQIAYKLKLGSEKDIEDARHLYRLFKDILNVDLLNNLNRKIKVEDLFSRYLK